jgi:hypothetical protein
MARHMQHLHPLVPIHLPQPRLRPSAPVHGPTGAADTTIGKHGAPELDDDGFVVFVVGPGGGGGVGPGVGEEFGFGEVRAGRVVSVGEQTRPSIKLETRPLKPAHSSRFETNSAAI